METQWIPRFCLGDTVGTATAYGKGKGKKYAL